MKIFARVPLVLVVAGLATFSARATPTNTFTISPSTVSDDDLAVITSASRHSQSGVADVTIHGLSISFDVYLEGYKGGKATRFAYQPERQRWYPAAKDVIAKVCFSLQMNEPAALESTNNAGGESKTVPGTGSMRLGTAFRLISGVPKNESSTSLVVSNADFDLHRSKLVRCADLPFTIVNRNGAVPLFAIFPESFEISSFTGFVDSSKLPDNTIVAYGESTTVVSDEDAWQTTLRSELTNAYAYSIRTCTLGYTFFQEPAELVKVLETHTTNELFPVFAELRKEPPDWKAGMVNGWSNIVVKGLRGNLYTNISVSRWSSNNDIISKSSIPMYSYREGWWPAETLATTRTNRPTTFGQ